VGIANFPLAGLARELDDQRSLSVHQGLQGGFDGMEIGEFVHSGGPLAQLSGRLRPAQY